MVQQILHCNSTTTTTRSTNAMPRRFNGDVNGFVAGSEKMAGGGSTSTHSICPVEIHVHGDKALSESTGSIMARFQHGGASYDCTSYARFVSRLQRVDGDWKMLTLEAIYERDTIQPSFPGVPSAPPLDIKTGRESYKCLGWLLSQKGFNVDQGLPGTDLPESVQSFMEEHSQWLRQ